MQNNKKLKLLMLMSNLDDLGVQRVVINIYKHLPDDIEPIIVFWRKEGKVSKFFIPRGRVYETDINNFPIKSIYRLFTYVKIIKAEKPDVILSFIPGTNLSIALIKLFISPSIKLIASEHAFITRAFQTGEYDSKFGKIYKRLIPFMYNKVFHKLIMTAYIGKEDAVNNWGIKSEKIDVIYNPQDIEDINTRADEILIDHWFQNDIPIIIGAGRLTAQKGFEKLIKAFALLSEKRKVKLAILGRGELEKKLKEQVESLKLSENIKFYGFQTNHLKFFKNASIFALSSVWEAMPMVLAEALVVGIPIISFDCPSGPKELLNNGERGILVKDQDVIALAEALDSALSNYNDIQRKSKIGQKWANEMLNAQYITDQYVAMIKTLLT